MQLFLLLLNHFLPSALPYLSLYLFPLFSSFFLHLPTRFHFSLIVLNDHSRSRRLLVKVRSVKLKLSAFGVSPTDEGMTCSSSGSCSFTCCSTHNAASFKFYTQIHPLLFSLFIFFRLSTLPSAEL